METWYCARFMSAERLIDPTVKVSRNKKEIQEWIARRPDSRRYWISEVER